MKKAVKYKYLGVNIKLAEECNIFDFKRTEMVGRAKSYAAKSIYIFFVNKSKDFTRWGPPAGKNTKKKIVDREILSGCSLWSQKRAQSIQHARITIVSAQEHHTTPPELRDRCIWSCSDWFSLKINAFPFVFTIIGNTKKSVPWTSNRSISKLRWSWMVFLGGSNSNSSMLNRLRTFLGP